MRVERHRIKPPRRVEKCLENRKEGSTSRSLTSDGGRSISPHLFTTAARPFRLKRGLASRARCAGQLCQFLPIAPREVRGPRGKTLPGSSNWLSARSMNWLVRDLSLASRVCSTNKHFKNFTLNRKSSSACSVACVTICVPSLSTLNLHPSIIP